MSVFSTRQVSFPCKPRVQIGRHRKPSAESLEARMLLAGDLLAQWRAQDLVGTVGDGEALSSWTDSVANIEGSAVGEPLLVEGQFGGRAAIRFDPSNGSDGIKILSQASPLTGRSDFTVFVSFATASNDLTGNQGNWFDNTALVDANALGFSTDWGITMNSQGQIAAGLGAGLAAPPVTLYSTASGLNDGQVHTVAFVRQASSMSLFVDDLPADSRNDGPTDPISPNTIGIGQLGPDGNYFSGMIAEVRFYDGAMESQEVAATQSDIFSYYNNQLPVANADHYLVPEDSPIFFVTANQGVLANDTDAEGDPLTATIVSSATTGSLALNEDGSFAYSPSKDFFGDVTFEYSAVDFRPSLPATVTIEVTPVYDPAVPVSDSYQSLPTELLVVDVNDGLLANDKNPDKADLTVQLENTVANGQLQLNADGSFVYDPKGFAGTTSFSYRVNDGTQLSNPTDVVLVLNTPPQIEPDVIELLEDSILERSAQTGVLANDSDADGDTLTASLTSEPSNGTIEFHADGSFKYVPNQNYFGQDEFRYTITDGVDTSAESTVQLNIQSVNDAPEAVGDSFVTLPGQSLDISPATGVLANDADVDGPQDLQAILAESTKNGILQLNSDGSFSYQPNNNFVGLDTFVYRASDSETESASQTVSIRVDPEPVRISEFMSANAGSLLTRTRLSAEDSFRRRTEEAFDWIEVQNPFNESLDIGGFFLTDNNDNLSKWPIPEGTIIEPNGEMVFFASGLNIVDPALDENGFLHTNFKIQSNSEYLAITAPGEVVLFSYEVYPNQRPDISYGVGADGTRMFFPEPTPGADNGEGIAGDVDDTEFSIDRGFYSETQMVEITTATDGADIYYTTDGSEPTPDNPTATKYAAAVEISKTTTLRAAAFRADLIPSNVDTQTYIFIDQVINQDNEPAGFPTIWENKHQNRTIPADYEMDPEITQSPKYSDIIDDALLQVPTISVVTDIDNLFDPATGIYQNPLRSGVDWERPASVELIHPDGTIGFQVNAGLRIQGGASREPRKSPKHSFRLLFKDIYGASKLQYPLFGAEAIDEFDTIILRAGFNQSYIHHNTFLGDNRGRAQYVRDQWGKDAQREMGWNAPHNAYAHLYINGIYWGLYNPTERPTDGFGASYFGGEKEEYDVYNSGELLDGTSDSWNGMFDIVLDRDLSDDEKYESLQSVLDMDAYIDYMLINHYGANADWDDHNWYSLRRRTDDGKWYFFMWDSEFLFIGENDNATRTSDGPRFPARIMRELTGSEEFLIRVADRMQKHFYNDGALTPEESIRRWNARSDQITDAIVAESARWGDYRRDVDPNSFPAGTPFELLERDVQWVRERERLLNEYFPGRTQTVIEQYRRNRWFPSIDAPIFSQRGGTVNGDTEISLQAEDGVTIYYTLDGSDPRLPGGEINPDAIQFQNAFQVSAGTTVRARGMTTDGEWSALDEAKFLFETVPASATSLRISEIHYHPADPSAEEIAAGYNNDDDFEYLELINISNQTIDLTDVRFVRQTDGNNTVGVDFDFSLGDITQLAPGERLLVVEDREAFEFRYASDLPIAGQWSGGLNNASELLTLVAGEETIHSFSYQDDWHPTTDGGGHSLEFINPSMNDLAQWGTGVNWRASAQEGGSPGVSGTQRIPGDSNFDGVFNSSDLVLVFRAGEYEDEIPGNSTFEEGDWNGDGDFTTSDLVFAFRAGTYVAAAVMQTQPSSDLVGAATMQNDESVTNETSSPNVQQPVQSLDRGRHMLLFDASVIESVFNAIDSKLLSSQRESRHEIQPSLTASANLI